MKKAMNPAIILVLILSASSVVFAEWKPAQAPLQTKWAAEVSPTKALPEYPRPQLVRDSWQSLNGLWKYAVTKIDAEKPSQWHGEILVPFAIESALSGVRTPLEADEHLWYERTFLMPAAWKGKRIQLNFEAVDWQSKVWINGQELGVHEGGYTPFSFDITRALKPGDNTLTVRAFDPTEQGNQPLGKQSRANFYAAKGIRYTPTSGIWQTVWLEALPETAVKTLRFTPDVDNNAVKVRVDLSGPAAPVKVQIGNVSEVLKSGVEQVIKIPQARLWSPDDPFLYDVKIMAGDDAVQSYFGLRKIEVLDVNGTKRIFLNNKPIFQVGTLDQGYWPDGVMTPPTDAAIVWDIEQNKAHGFNLIRKHVKRESARWYYWADKLGMLVWQDAVSPAGKYGMDRRGQAKPAGLLPAEGRSYYEYELKAMLDDLHNHPSIIQWIVFNEGWGQYDTERLTKEVMTRDPSRLVCDASGWTGSGTGHIGDCHNYPEPGLVKHSDSQAMVCGEFGGLNYVLKDHIWDPQAPLMRGNRPECNAHSDEEFLTRYSDLIDLAVKFKAEGGLCAAVYTELADIEAEPNGFATYDRVLKVDPTKMKAINDRITQKPHTAKP